MTKKPINSSNLALRFYRSDGWTEEELKQCLKVGDLIFREDFLLSGVDLSYWTLDHNKGSSFDVDKLLERMSHLHRRFDDRPQETDRQFLMRMNW